jgi:hypothetical protein
MRIRREDEANGLRLSVGKYAERQGSGETPDDERARRSR